MSIYFSIQYISSPGQISLTAVDGGWIVYNLPQCDDCPADRLQDGDLITRIGDMDYQAHVFMAPFAAYAAGDLVTVEILRPDGPVQTSFRIPDVRPSQRIVKLLIFIFWLPFWLCAAWLAFYAPRRTKSAVMSLMFAGYSMWIPAGFVSSAFVPGASVIVHAVTWLLVPLSAHVHWISPYPFRNVGNRMLGFIYAAFVLLAVVEIFQAIPRQIFTIGTVLMVIVPLVLLAAHRNKAYLNAKRLMSLGIITLTVPLVTWLIISFDYARTGGNATISLILAGGAALLALPAFPILYIYANYRQFWPARIEQRVWRVLVMLVYISIMMVAITAAITMAGTTLVLDEAAINLSLIVATVISVAVALGTNSAQNWMKRFTYGNFENNVARASEVFSAQMTELTGPEQLERFLSEKIHSILEVSSSALYLVGSELMLRFVRGDATAPEILKPNNELISKLGRSQTNGSEHLPWVRLSLPLLVQQELVGVWLLGARKNDDFYSGAHIQQLQSLGNQVAAVVEMRRQQREIERQVITIVAKEKEAALGRVVTSVSHQFRNPLQVIMGALEADNDYHRPEKEWLKLAYERAGRLADVVRSIQRFAQVDNDDPKVLVDVNEAIGEAMLLIAHRMKEKGIEVVRKGSMADLCVRMGLSDLTQVVLNLLENASDAQQGGEIVVTTRSEDGAVFVTVQDSGKGIPAGLLDHIFEPLFTTKNGLGLGLWIARSIIEHNSGTVRVESELGHGSIFTIELPKAT